MPEYKAKIDVINNKIIGRGVRNGVQFIITDDELTEKELQELK